MVINIENVRVAEWFRRLGANRALVALVGTLANVNIPDRQHLLEAHAETSTHPDLIVRVTGFSAYFVLLSRGFRQLVVDWIISGM